MRDVEFYQQLLGLASPWTVSKVELSVKDQRVDIWAEHKEGLKWPCPECGKKLALYDHTDERVWRHLDTMQFKTFLHARPPRVKCEDHGVVQVKLSWSEPNSRFAGSFERFAIDVLRECDVHGATKILGVSWDEAWHIQERAVARGLLVKGVRVIPYLAVDEKAVAKGHHYMTLVCDHANGTVEYIADGRKQESLDGYWRTLTPEQLKGIEAVSMDMWEAYIQSVLEHVPDGEKKIVFDKFHIVQHMNEAVDDVRKEEHLKLQEAGKSPLAKSKYIWLYAEENLPLKHWTRFEELKALNLKTGRAWAIKESLRGLWDYVSEGWARRFWKDWNSWAMRSKLEPVKEVARMIKSHLANVMTYFTHRITNAVAEGLNSKIQTIKKRAYGYRNPEHFKTAVLFHCGGLQLYPKTHTVPG
jgi:transposase